MPNTPHSSCILFIRKPLFHIKKDKDALETQGVFAFMYYMTQRAVCQEMIYYYFFKCIAFVLTIVYTI